MFIRGKQSILHRVAFELRYLYGYTFLDRCGRTINAIMREMPDFVPSNQISPQNSPLLSLENNCVFNFNSTKLDMSIDQSLGNEIPEADVQRFLEQINLASKIVVDELGLVEFIRIGFRAIYAFQCDSKEDSEIWLANLGLYCVDKKLNQTFEGATESIGIAVILSGSDRMYRIGFDGVERGPEIQKGDDSIHIRPRSLHKDQAKVLKKRLRDKGRLSAMPRYAALVDVDAFQEDPIYPDCADFATTSHQQIKDKLYAAMKIN